ncbi:MAG: SMC-Scp complex subunit ScpB [Mycoplasmoidaceae bacterium]
MTRKKNLIEALLFLNGKKGITIDELCNTLAIDHDSIKSELDDLIEDFSSSERGLMVKKFGSKYMLVTKPEIYDQIFKEKNEISKNPLNNSLIETLAIIAYNSPCTRTKIHDIRKIDPSQQIVKLLELGLINELGRADTQGKPFLYKVSDKFFDIFGINDLSELPEIKDVSNSEDDDVDFFDSNREE